MNEEKETLCQQLGMVNTDLGFLLVIVAGVLLAFLDTVRERDVLCLSLQGETERAKQVEDTTIFRLASDALVVGALGFFFTQALKLWQTGSDDPIAQKSARFNLFASFLVLLAALIRLLNFNFVRRTQPALAGDLLPD